MPEKRERFIEFSTVLIMRESFHLSFSCQKRRDMRLLAGVSHAHYCIILRRQSPFIIQAPCVYFFSKMSLDMEMGLIYNEMHKKSLRNVLVFQVRSHQNSK